MMAPPPANVVHNRSVIDINGDNERLEARLRRRRPATKIRDEGKGFQA
jgi:hypothetical protein